MIHSVNLFRAINQFIWIGMIKSINWFSEWIVKPLLIIHTFHLTPSPKHLESISRLVPLQVCWAPCHMATSDVPFRRGLNIRLGWSGDKWIAERDCCFHSVLSSVTDWDWIGDQPQIRQHYFFPFFSHFNSSVIYYNSLSSLLPSFLYSMLSPSSQNVPSYSLSLAHS